MTYLALEQVAQERIRERQVEACRERMLNKITSGEPGIVRRSIWNSGRLLIGIGSALQARTDSPPAPETVFCEVC